METSNQALYMLMLNKMLHIRYFEEQICRYFAEKRIHGTTHLYIGEEAIATGASIALKNNDYITSTHRGHGHAIAKGTDPKYLMAEMLGKSTGTSHGKGGSMHIYDVEHGNIGSNGIVGGSIPIAVGAGLSIKRLKEDKIVLCYFGDGATNEGTFHEALNLASLWKVPVIFLCENNQYGLSTSIKKSTNIDNIANRAASYGIKSVNVDGMDAFTVYNAIKSAREYVKENGPIFVVAETYRFVGHSKSDRNLYRTQEEIAEWKKRDPIDNMIKTILKETTIAQDEIEKIKLLSKKDIEDAVTFAENSPDALENEMMENVYA